MVSSTAWRHVSSQIHRFGASLTSLHGVLVLTHQPLLVMKKRSAWPHGYFSLAAHFQHLTRGNHESRTHSGAQRSAIFSRRFAFAQEGSFVELDMEHDRARRQIGTWQIAFTGVRRSEAGVPNGNRGSHVCGLAGIYETTRDTGKLRDLRL